MFFDNIQVVHTRGAILEENHYYPFGMVMAGVSSKAAGTLKNKEKTFQGQRFDDDLDLNWVQFKWRNHDPQIGRFVEIDPLAEKYVYNSTYAFSENKVTRHVELEGLEAVLPNPTGNAAIGIYNLFAGWGQDLKQGADNLKQGAINKANLQSGANDNLPVPIRDIKSVNADLQINAGVAQMVKPGLEAASYVAGIAVGLETHPSPGLLTASNMGLKSTVGLSYTGGINTVVKESAIEASQLSPNVQKIVNLMSELKANGGTITPNPLKPNQELNLTIKNIEMMDFRIETHVVPTKFGGNGVTPQRHMNVDLYPDKKVLPNSGHKILE